MRYTPKHTDVEAFQYGVDTWPQWFQHEIDTGRVHTLSAGDEYVIPSCIIEGERNQICAHGNYVVRYSDGEIVIMGRERFEERFEARTRKNTNTSRANSIFHRDVPSSWNSIHGDELIIEIHFVDGSCQPFFQKGFERDDTLRQDIIDSIYESECFRPLTYDAAYALIDSVVRRFFSNRTQTKKTSN